MCGIVACRTSAPAVEFLLPALSRLEYRGYDSAGVALTARDRDALHTMRAVGRLAVLEDMVAMESPSPDLGIGIGHTRWATHGAVSEPNAHPHRDCGGAIAVVHNGIIDNADELRARLQSGGHRFSSEVDSEVIAHLVEEAYASCGSLVEAVRRAVHQLRGTWALAVTSANSAEVVLACYRSPLVVGSSETEHFAGSDMIAMIGRVAHVHVLQDGDIVELADHVSWTDMKGNQLTPRSPVTVDWDAEDAEIGVYEDFMEKEISEQPAVSARLLDRLLPGVANGLLWKNLALPSFRSIRFLACGSSLNAAAAAARVFRDVADIPARTIIASEFEEKVGGEVLTIAVSQSGETADIVSALRQVHGPVLLITNAPYSTLARGADAVIDCGSGPEIGVAATKTFTTQVIAGAALGLSAAAALGRSSGSEISQQALALAKVPDRLEAAHLTSFPVAHALAGELAQAPGFFFVSRGAGMPYATEGALKLKEITYRWCDAIPAGELKHGSISLIEDGTPVVVIDSGSPVRLHGAASEMATRGARIIRIGPEGSGAAFPVLADVEGPWGPLEGVLALQHLARSVAVALGRDCDKPRNLAKSVTVL